MGRVVRATGDSWLLEIAGYSTPDYIHKKLAALRRANLPKLIVAIDEERACTDEALGLDAQLVRFRRKLDPKAVLAIIDPTAAKAVVSGTRKRPGPKAPSEQLPSDTVVPPGP